MYQHLLGIYQGVNELQPLKFGMVQNSFLVLLAGWFDGEEETSWELSSCHKYV
jgi:hypothetical protein